MTYLPGAGQGFGITVIGVERDAHSSDRSDESLSQTAWQRQRLCVRKLDSGVPMVCFPPERPTEGHNV